MPYSPSKPPLPPPGPIDWIEKGYPPKRQDPKRQNDPLLGVDEGRSTLLPLKISLCILLFSAGILTGIAIGS